MVQDFHFQSGETMPEVRLPYYTFGKPAKDANGRTTSAVLILHGTSGRGTQFLRPIFAGVLFNPGQLLDATKYFIIIPDNVGHGKSSKPSDGLHARFPQYDYADMVTLQHEFPASEQTHGHGTHTYAAVWQGYLNELLERSGSR